MTPRLRPGRTTDLMARACVGALFVLLSVNVLEEFRRTGHLTGLLLLASESLVVALTIVRRRAAVVNRSAWAAAVTLVSVAGQPLLRVGAVAPLAPDALTAVLSGAGLAVVILGKLALGRSFGIVPANRGVVARGPYNVVRHPIYAGYVITHLAFVIAHPTVWNVAVVLAADTSLIARSLIEERVLGTDAAYRAYCARVAWHLVPGVF